MAVDPSSDIMLEVAKAADPARAAAAAQRLNALAAAAGADGPDFAETLAATASAATSAADARTRLADVAASADDKATRVKTDFEAVMLNSFVSQMLPKDAESVFGEGLAGDMWKSMLADQVSRQIAKTDALGIGKRLFLSHPLAAAGALEQARRAEFVERGRRHPDERQFAGAAQRRRRPWRVRPVRQREAFMSPPVLRVVPGGRMQSPAAMVMPVIERLLQTLDEENEGISRRARVDYDALNRRKSQGLLELNRLTPSLAGMRLGPALAAGLADLQARLETNRRLLGAQLTAARAVSDIITQTIRDSQSDGTYSDRYWVDE